MGWTSGCTAFPSLDRLIHGARLQFRGVRLQCLIMPFRLVDLGEELPEAVDDDGVVRRLHDGEPDVALEIGRLEAERLLVAVDQAVGAQAGQLLGLGRVIGAFCAWFGRGLLGS